MIKPHPPLSACREVPQQSPEERGVPVVPAVLPVPVLRWEDPHHSARVHGRQGEPPAGGGEVLPIMIHSPRGSWGNHVLASVTRVPSPKSPILHSFPFFPYPSCPVHERLIASLVISYMFRPSLFSPLTPCPGGRWLPSGGPQGPDAGHRLPGGHEQVADPGPAALGRGP